MPVAAISLPVLLLLGAGIGERNALCLGNDGHIAVDAADTGTCAPFSSVFGPRGPSLSKLGSIGGSSRTHCGPCVDVISLSGLLTHATFSSHHFRHLTWYVMSLWPTPVRSDDILESAGGGVLGKTGLGRY